jgi:hypothetical protein
VFPLAPRGKRPLTAHGLKDACTDPKQIQAWWSTWPDANLGFAVPEGVVVVDLDTRDAGEQLKARGLTLPASLTCKTARGSHVYLRGADFKNTAGKIMAHVDTRAAGGYTILPPSVHPSGAVYAWVDDAADFAEAPAWLRNSVRRGRRHRRELADTAGPVEQGQRNDTLFQIACGYRREGKDQHEIAELLHRANEENCKPPLPDAEVEQIAESAASYDPGGRQGRERPKQSDLLLGLCDAGVEFHHDPDGLAHVTFRHDGARKTARLRSSTFRSWLSWRAYSELEVVASTNALQEALNVLEGRAVHDGELVRVHRRIAEHCGRIYLDLADEEWRAVEIDAAGWRVVQEPPVHFVRGAGMLPLPVPTAGKVHDLRRFINVATNADFEVCVGWLLGALQPRGPFPVLALSGRQGSAKSTAARLLISMIDASKAPLRSAPKSEDDLLVSAQHGRVICFDNVSGLSASLSDALCRLATGGGTAKRKLYTDDEAIILDVSTPVILTGIGNYIQRGDLADRALPVNLRPLRDGEYQPERDLMRQFEAARAGILGGLLDALSCSIRRRSEVTGATRMADFDSAVEAAGPALGWAPGHFNRLLADVRDHSRRSHVEDDDLAQALMALPPWQGTMGALRDRLAGDGPKPWLPRSARGLSAALTRLEPALEHVGLVINRSRRAGERIVALEWNTDRNDV